MKYKLSILLTTIFCAGCDVAQMAIDGAPLFSTTVVDKDSYKENMRVVKAEYLLREGSYCTYLIAQGYNQLDQDQIKDLFSNKLTVKYKLEVPALNIKKNTDLGSFPDALPGYNFSHNYYFKKISLDIDGLEKGRTAAYLTATFSGNEELLVKSRFKIMFSEWGCK